MEVRNSGALLPVIPQLVLFIEYTDARFWDKDIYGGPGTTVSFFSFVIFALCLLTFDENRLKMTF